MTTDNEQLEVLVEYDGFLAGRELAEILEVLDEAVWYELDEPFLSPSFRYRYSRRFQEAPPIFCLTEANKGSLLLTGMLGGAAATYCLNRFKRGFRRGHFGDEIEHFGEIVSNRLGVIVERVNQWLDEYVSEAREHQSRIKSVRVRRKRPGGDKS
jgi:hypothetical protein